MRRGVLLSGAYLLDQFAGDPEWFPHPVRLMGFAIARGEAALRRPGDSKTFELSAGAALTLVLAGSTYWLTAWLIRWSYRHSRSAGDAAELLLGWTCLAARNLEQESTAVTEALTREDLIAARSRLSRIVGRDTVHLQAQEISRAVIETVSESASDGVLAPLFYMYLGGAPLAMTYKAINTLDSMIGHADSKYLYFGRAAARLDDAANFLPARVTAFAIILAARLTSGSDPRSAWRTWRRDGAKHKSPNAGQPESSIAGALHVRLGGDNTYAGELVQAQCIGEEFPAATPDKASDAIRLISVASFLGLAISVLLTILAQNRKRR